MEHATGDSRRGVCCPAPSPCPSKRLRCCFINIRHPTSPSRIDLESHVKTTHSTRINVAVMHEMYIYSQRLNIGCVSHGLVSTSLNSVISSLPRCLGFCTSPEFTEGTHGVACGSQGRWFCCLNQVLSQQLMSLHVCCSPGCSEQVSGTSRNSQQLQLQPRGLGRKSVGKRNGVYSEGSRFVLPLPRMITPSDAEPQPPQPPTPGQPTSASQRLYTDPDNVACIWR